MNGNIMMDPWVIVGLACIIIAHLVWVFVMFKPKDAPWDERVAWWGVYLFIFGTLAPVIFSDAI